MKQIHAMVKDVLKTNSRGIIDKQQILALQYAYPDCYMYRIHHRFAYLQI